jgi:hypothetical protein
MLETQFQQVCSNFQTICSAPIYCLNWILRCIINLTEYWVKKGNFISCYWK